MYRGDPISKSLKRSLHRVKITCRTWPVRNRQFWQCHCGGRCWQSWNPCESHPFPSGTSVPGTCPRWICSSPPQSTAASASDVPPNRPSCTAPSLYSSCGLTVGPRKTWRRWGGSSAAGCGSPRRWVPPDAWTWVRRGRRSWRRPLPLHRRRSTGESVESAVHPREVALPDQVAVVVDVVLDLLARLRGGTLEERFRRLAQHLLASPGINVSIKIMMKYCTRTPLPPWRVSYICGRGWFLMGLD